MSEKGKCYCTAFVAITAHDAAQIQAPYFDTHVALVSSRRIARTDLVIHRNSGGNNWPKLSNKSNEELREWVEGGYIYVVYT